MHRRQALARLSLLVGGAISAPTLSAFLSGCKPPSATGSFQPSTLVEDEFTLIGTLVDIILPETDTPGALAAGVDRYIDEVLTDVVASGDRERFLAGLTAFSDRVQKELGIGFLSLTNGQQLEFVTALDQKVFLDAELNSEQDAASSDETPATAATFFTTLKELTILGYYTSEIGATQELHVMPMGAYRAIVPLDEIKKTWA